MKTLVKMFSVLAIVAMLSGVAFGKTIELTEDGEIKYPIAAEENEEDAKIVAGYKVKEFVSDELAKKLIKDHGFVESKEKIAAAIRATHHFDITSTVKKGSVLILTGAVVANVDTIRAFLNSSSLRLKELSCEVSKELDVAFKKMWECRKKRDFSSDKYRLALNKLKAENYRQNAVATTGTKSVESVRKSVELDSDNTLVRLDAAKVEYKDGDSVKGDEHVDYLQKVEPMLLEGYLVAGGKYIQAGELNFAYNEIKKALKIDPNNAAANYMMANYYDRKGETEKAAEYQAIAAKNNVVKVTEDEGANTAVESKASVGGSGGEIEIDFSEVNAYYKKNDAKGAIRELEKLLKAHPGNITVIYNLGFCYENMEKYSTAIEYYKQIIRYYKAPYKIGQCYDKMGKNQEAYNYYVYYEKYPKLKKITKEKDPEILANANSAISNLFYDVDEYEKGIKYGKLSVESAPTAYGHYILGLNYLENKDYQEAYDAFSNAHKLKPKKSSYEQLMKKAKSKM